LVRPLDRPPADDVSLVLPGGQVGLRSLQLLFL
jgi:hypothetical protein